MQFLQNYDPLGSPLLSTLVAALPLVTLLYLLAFHPWRDRQGNKRRGIDAPKAAGLASLLAFLIAIIVLRMPALTAGAAFVYGAATGLVPIGWVLLAAMFLYTLTVVTGQFDVVKDSISRVSSDPRIQVLIIAFSLGSFLEGAAGFGIPVAIAGAMMVGLGFKPFQAAVLNLLANAVPVAFGAIGTPIITLATVTGLDQNLLSSLVSIELLIFCLTIPTLVIAVMAKMDGKPWRKVWEVWPALVVSGITFSAAQYYTATYMGPSLVGILSGLVSLAALIILCMIWKPAPYHEEKGAASSADQPTSKGYTASQIASAWVPWLLLTIFVFLWGQPDIKAALARPLAGIIPTVIKLPIPFLNQVVFRMPPVVPTPTAEKAVFTLDWLATPGTSLFLAALLSGLWMRMSAAQWKEAIVRTATRMKAPLMTVCLVLGFSYLTRYTGTDGILGLAFTQTGLFYPFFAPLLGWLGVFITGSDTSANAMFGSLQQITARQLGLNEYLITSANTAGGVTGKMIGAQSIVVATAATYENREEGKKAVGEILRAVVWYSLIMAVMMGGIIMSLAYLFPGLLPG